MKIIKTAYTLLFAFMLVLPMQSQNRRINKLKERTLDVAYQMYKSELASWESTDILQNEYPELIPKIGGYLSYNEGDVSRSIYYDRSNEKKVLVSITFPQILELSDMHDISLTERQPSEYELRLISAREKSRATLRENPNEVFQFYENVNLNFVPLLVDDKLVVYALSATNSSTTVFFGNDYKFEFDKDDAIINISRIHNSIIGVPFRAEEGESSIESAMHSHVIEDYPIMTETDLCTLLLYAPYVEWKQCYVLGDKYVSIWDMEKEELLVLTRKAWEKISGKN